MNNQYQCNWTDQFEAHVNFIPPFDLQNINNGLSSINADTEHDLQHSIRSDIRRVKLLANHRYVKYNRMFMSSINKYLSIVDNNECDTERALYAMIELRRRLINDSNHSDTEIQNFLWK